MVEHEVGGDWPRPDLTDLARLALLLDGLPDGALLLVDGLVASAAASVLPAASARLAVVVLLHMPLGPGAAEETVLASAAAVVTTSDWTRSQVRSWYGLRHVYAVRPGTDAAPLAAGSGAGTSLLCVATVHPGKGHDLLLEALARLGDRPWTLVCVGSLDVDPDHVDRAPGAGVRPSLGATGHLRRPAGRRRARRGVRPGRPGGAAVASARATGWSSPRRSRVACPCVATRTGGVPEALGRAPGGTLPGLLVTPDDPAALADGLSRWLDERHLRDRLRRAAALRRPTLPGWDLTASDLADVLSRVGGRVGARAGTGGRR